jgi:hypothetical protein
MSNLVVSLAAYRFVRVLAYDGMCSSDIRPCRGLAAGSAEATFE